MVSSPHGPEIAATIVQPGTCGWQGPCNTSFASYIEVSVYLSYFIRISCQ